MDLDLVSAHSLPYALGCPVPSTMDNGGGAVFDIKKIIISAGNTGLAPRN